ncbi:MAG TPA: hypothetical protein VGO48_04660 [Conexibacter sp.]|nr:hypothetical protein [Conexibacter sp.]
MSAAAQVDAQLLPELASVYWRPRMTAERLRRRERLWTFTTLAHVVPFVVVAIVMVLLSPLALPVSLAALAHAWLIPELYARRGATVTRELRPGPDGPERVSLGLLGDLVDHDARDLHARTGLVPEPGQLGTWLVGEAGALLVAGRRVSCWCVRATDPEGARLPSGDRVAHLLLALRSDEEGFATVANLAFSGARWRVRRRLPKRQRAALDAVA